MSELKEAERWLESANLLVNSGPDDSSKYTVAIAQAIHAIIRANDALTARFLHRTAMRHDEAPLLFLELVRLNKIPAKFADFRTTVLMPAIQTKSKADYRGLKAGKADAERWLRDAEKFLKCAKECIEQ